MARPVSAQTECVPFSDLDENASLDLSGIDSSHDHGSSTGETYVQYSLQTLIQPSIDLSVGSKRKSDNEVDESRQPKKPRIKPPPMDPVKDGGVKVERSWKARNLDPGLLNVLRVCPSFCLIQPTTDVLRTLLVLPLVNSLPRMVPTKTKRGTRKTMPKHT